MFGWIWLTSGFLSWWGEFAFGVIWWVSDLVGLILVLVCCVGLCLCFVNFGVF